MFGLPPADVGDHSDGDRSQDQASNLTLRIRNANDEAKNAPDNH